MTGAPDSKVAQVADRLLSLGARASLGALDLLQGRDRRLSILIFHRVLRQPDPIFPAEVDANRFDRFMRLVAANFRVLPLADAVDGLQQRRLPPRALSITFDDGYADNHAVALPILQRHGLTACFFIATGFLSGGRMFNDTVIECIRHCPHSQLDLAVLGLGVLPLQTPMQRAQAIAQVLPRIKYQSPDQRTQALALLQKACSPSHLPDDLMMTPEQVRALRAAGMEIGAHTVRHPILCQVDDATAERELFDSRAALQQMIQQPVTLMAYPNGQPDRDYALRHAQMAHRLGFSAAVTTAAGVARAGADVFQLPRFTPWDSRAAPWLARLVATRRQRRYQCASGLAAVDTRHAAGVGA